MDERAEKRRAYYRQYYKDHVNLEQERKRKQEFYEKNKEQILAKAKERYQRKKA
jgi:hypothetical protein